MIIRNGFFLDINGTWRNLNYVRYFDIQGTGIIAVISDSESDDPEEYVDYVYVDSYDTYGEAVKALGAAFGEVDDSDRL
jgi:hypothetical protein